MPPSLNRNAARKAIYSSVSRILSVIIGAGAGSYLKELVGEGTLGWSMVITMSAVSIVLMIVSEYEKER